MIGVEIEGDWAESALSKAEVLKQDICEFGKNWWLINTGVPHLVCEDLEIMGLNKEDLRFLRHKYNANINIASCREDRVLARTFGHWS